MSDQIELVTLTIDGKETQVPKGTNLIEAALGLGIEIPFYCYHKHLSIAGNCRMCQVHVEGSPKLMIGCNTSATNGMVVKTQTTSPEVADAQRATLEFLLINHPLDCTVCDQAGHCKLQDYYFEYNKKASRFIEEKTDKVKAEVLGPEVVYDGERCIVCTRCVRFCDEVTKTGELSVLNRGDRTVIAVHEDRPLDNPFSGTTVDLCPVGALTHRQWRFNSRIWYSRGADSICPGCSTGCNVQVAVRDNTLVQVKGRLNSEVNKEWLCDEGRYGFERFQPKLRLEKPLVRNGQYLEELEWSEALTSLKSSYQSLDKNNSDVLFVLSPFLTLEEMWTSLTFAEKVFGVKLGSNQIAIQYRSRALTELESILISPDYAPNARSAQILGYFSDATDWRADFQNNYEKSLDKIRNGEVKTLVVIGDQAILDADLNESLISKILEIPFSLALSPRGVIGQSETSSEFAKDEESLGVHQLIKFIFPTVTVNEKNGIFVNRDMRLQKLNKLLEPPRGVLPEWMVLKKIAEFLGKQILPSNIVDDRSLFLEMASKVGTLEGMTLREIGSLGSSRVESLNSSQSSLESSI